MQEKLENNLLLDLHIGLITSYSTLKITAVIITAARLALGIYAQYGIIRPKVNMTKAPVHKQPNVVLTPEAELTAVLEKDPVIGMAETKELIKLQIPKATIS